MVSGLSAQRLQVAGLHDGTARSPSLENADGVMFKTRLRLTSDRNSVNSGQATVKTHRHACCRACAGTAHATRVPGSRLHHATMQPEVPAAARYECASRLALRSCIRKQPHVRCFGLPTPSARSSRGNACTRAGMADSPNVSDLRPVLLLWDLDNLNPRRGIAGIRVWSAQLQVSCD